MSRDKSSVSRREALQQIGIVGIGAIVSACGTGGGSSQPTPSPTRSLTPTGLPSATSTPTVAPTGVPSATPSPSRTPTDLPTSTATATVTPDQLSCILTPEETIGPYFIDVGLSRSDIREDRTGARLRLSLQLVAVDGCTPIRDAVVNVWHADATGIYSGFAGQPGGIDTRGETFLRGFQVTDADGRVEFTTVYPGWYTSRTVHIHVRIHLDSTTVLITQLYFAESLTTAVYAQEPYSSRGLPDTTNATDSLARNDLDELLLDVVEDDDGYTGSIVFGVSGV